MRRISFALAAAAALASFASALTPQELKTPAEIQLYETIKANPAEVAVFLATRDYVHKAEAVLKGKLSASELPGKPKNFSKIYLLPGEKDTVNEAVKISVAALAQAMFG